MISQKDIVFYALVGLEDRKEDIKRQGGDMHDTPERMRDRAKRLEKYERDYELLTEVNRELYRRNVND